MRWKTPDDEFPTINLTPMLDVVFNLIVFFMVGTQFVEMESQLDVDLPTVRDAAPMLKAPERKNLYVQKDGSLAINGKKIAKADLRSELEAMKAADPNLLVTLWGDDEVQFQHVAHALSVFRSAGISEASIAVRMESGSSQKR